MPRRRLVLAALAALTALAAAGACGLRRGAGGAGGPVAEIEFENLSLNPAEVLAVSRGGGRLRIGTVMPGRTQVLQVPSAAIAADLTTSIVARIRATARTPSTGSITLRPGMRVRVILPLDERMLLTLPAQEP